MVVAGHTDGVAVATKGAVPSANNFVFILPDFIHNLA